MSSNLKVTRQLSCKDSKNLRPLDILACNPVNPFSAEPFMVNCLCGWQGVNGIYLCTLKWPAHIRIRAHSTERVNEPSFQMSRRGRFLLFLQHECLVTLNKQNVMYIQWTGRVVIVLTQEKWPATWQVVKSVHEQLLSVDCPLLYACRVLIVYHVTKL